MKFDLMNGEENLTITGNEIFIKAGGKTDFFVDGCNEYKKANAPFYYSFAEDDFIIRSKICPEFINIYDAGCLLIYESDDKWIKLAFENTDLGYTSVVSVVTNGTSDDCNGEKINQDNVWLQIIRKGENWALHYSTDGEKWKMVRYFRLDFDKQVKIGICAQSPTGDFCKVKFEYLQICDNIYSDIRNMTK
jgi:regulation of enolase protein 1 (concanavalin A-like superfamily)